MYIVSKMSRDIQTGEFEICKPMSFSTKKLAEEAMNTMAHTAVVMGGSFNVHSVIEKRDNTLHLMNDCLDWYFRLDKVKTDNIMGV